MLLKPLRLFLEWYNTFSFGSVPIANRAQLPAIVYCHPWVGFGADAEAGGTAMGRVNSVSLRGAGVALGGPSRGEPGRASKPPSRGWDPPFAPCPRPPSGQSRSAGPGLGWPLSSGPATRDRKTFCRSPASPSLAVAKPLMVFRTFVCRAIPPPCLPCLTPAPL
jgi:hypothetical protein